MAKRRKGRKKKKNSDYDSVPRYDPLNQVDETIEDTADVFEPQNNNNSVPIQEQPPIVEQNSISFSSILIGGILGVCLGSALEKQTLSLNNNKQSNSILFNK